MQFVLLHWDWVTVVRPSVQRLLGASRKLLDQSHHVPEPGEQPLPPTWRRTYHPAFSDIQWTYDDTAPQFCCNGIKVVNLTNQHEDEFGDIEDGHVYRASRAIEALPSFIAARMCRCSIRTVLSL